MPLHGAPTNPLGLTGINVRLVPDEKASYVALHSLLKAETLQSKSDLQP